MVQMVNAPLEPNINQMVMLQISPFRSAFYYLQLAASLCSAYECLDMVLIF